MKKFFLIFVMVFIFFIGYNNVFAYSNYDSYYSLNLSDNLYDELETYSYNDTNLKELTDLLIDLNNEYNDYYNILITLGYNGSDFQSYYIELLPSSYTESINLSFYSTSSGTFNSIGELYNVSSRYFNLTYSNTLHNWSILTSDWYDNLSICLKTGVCNYSSSNDTYGYYANSSSSFPSYGLFFGFVNSNESISNTLNYDIDLQQIYLYSHNITFKTNYITDNSRNAFFKSIKINDELIANDSIIPSYHDLYFGNDELDFDINKELDNFNSLSNFYFRINKNNISNFNFTYEFNPNYSLTLAISNPNYFDDFYNDLSSEIKYFGRIYNSSDNYYTYESINCTLSHEYIKNSSSITSKGNNLTCTSDLSNYDYIFVYLRQFVSSTNSSSSVIGLNTNVNGALYHYGNNLNGFIYDIFSNVASGFKMSFSSNYIDSALVLSNVNNGAFAESIGTTDNESYIPLAQKEFPFRISYGFANSRYYVIYGDSSIYNGTRNIEVFIGDSTIISFNNSDTTDFYIYDNNKQIINVNAKVQFNVNIDTGDYDLSYYFSQVNNYIDGLSLQITNFGNLTQNFYDNLPGFLQIFLLVAFILSCIYFVFRLINK